MIEDFNPKPQFAHLDKGRIGYAAEDTGTLRADVETRLQNERNLLNQLQAYQGAIEFERLVNLMSEATEEERVNKERIMELVRRDRDSWNAAMADHLHNIYELSQLLALFESVHKKHSKASEGPSE